MTFLASTRPPSRPPPDDRSPGVTGFPSELGSATVEQTGLILFVALVFASLSGLLLMNDDKTAGRGIGERVANRISCGPRQPDACSHHPAVTAYGWPTARLLRYLAPIPMARPAADGTPLVPVDFRYCQRPSCAVPSGRGGGLRLTTANRRTTVFTEVRSLGEGRKEIVYWLYRPGIGWEDLHRRVGTAEIEAASGTEVLLKDSPVLVPLETLDGRNHIELPAGDTPPWQWRVTSTYNDPSR